jgi:hypothetical protein
MDIRFGGWNSKKKQVCGVGGGGGSSPPPTLTAERHPFPWLPHSSPVHQEKRTVKQQPTQSSPSQLRQCQLTESPSYRCKIEAPAPKSRRRQQLDHPSPPSPGMSAEESLRRSIRSIIGAGPCARCLTPPPSPVLPYQKGNRGKEGEAGNTHKGSEPRKPGSSFTLSIRRPKFRKRTLCSCLGLPSAEPLPHIGRQLPLA